MALTLTKLFLFSFLVSLAALTANSELLTSNQEKLTGLRVYVQDKITGSNATVAIVAQAPTTKQSATLFGEVGVVDDALTEGPKASSENVGRVQGIGAYTSQSEMALSMSLNFVFTEGNYRGSSLAVLGRNSISLKVREMPIVGGTGFFRLARGYAN